MKAFLLKFLKQAALFSLIIVSFSPFNTIVNAYSEDDARSFINNTPFYRDVELPECGAIAGAETVANQLPENIPNQYRALLGSAAAAYKTNVQYLAALYMTENGNVWKPFNSNWATSPAGASGPFQFMPGTWDAYKVDGNNDGVKDVNNIYDAAFAAANMASKNGVKESTPLGNLDTPFNPDPLTMMYAAAAYNWGSGNIQQHTAPDSPLTAGPVETQNYLKNVHSLITSGFTKSGHPNYPDPKGEIASDGEISDIIDQETGCSAGVVAQNIVQTAINFAWDTPDHGPNETDAKPEYRSAMREFNGSTGTLPFSDCGVFVATVMIATGADPSYPKRGTSVQLEYLRNHPEKYQLIEGVNDSSQLVPGDILIFAAEPSGHTYIYTGQSINGYTSVGASLGDHVPEVTPTYFSQTTGGQTHTFTVARLIK